MTAMRINIRIGKNDISSAVAAPMSEQQIDYSPYVVRSGISMAANLREAFKDDRLLQRSYSSANVLIDSPLLLVPVEEFSEDNLKELYHHSYPDVKSCLIEHAVWPMLNVVAAFSVNKDLNMVLHDHIDNIRFNPLVQPVVEYLHRRSYTGNSRKLYGYFHDGSLSIVSFDKNRLKFYNSFQTSNTSDAVYFLLYVWKALNLDAHRDELQIAGQIPDRTEMVRTLKKYVQNVYAINPTAEFNRASFTQIKNFPLDMMLMMVMWK